MKHTFLLITTVMLFSCTGSNCTRLQDVNNGRSVFRGFDLEDLNPCSLGNKDAPKQIFFNVKHESSCNLNEFHAAIMIDFKCVYYGTIEHPISLNLNLCDKHPYVLQLVLLNEKDDIEYSWENKQAYHLANFNRVTCTLFEQVNFDYSNGRELDVKLE